MDAPPVQYVTTSDGYSIAYGVSGTGRPLVILPGAFEHVQLAWQYPPLQPWLEGLTERFQVIQIDERGAGMSTRGLADDHEYQNYGRDIEAVVAKLNPAPFVLLGLSIRATTAIEFAVSHPERVSALVLSGLTPRNRPSFWNVLPEEDWDLFLYSLVPRDRSPEQGRKIVELVKQTYVPQDFARRRKSFLAYPAETPMLSRLRTPTLIMHPRDYVLSDSEGAMRMAQITGARMMLIDGSTVFGDADQGIRAIEAFLADLTPVVATRAPVRDGTLSAREVEVLRLITDGRSNAQIGEALVISPNTVGRHVSNIFDKIGAANRAEAATYALRHGLA